MKISKKILIIMLSLIFMVFFTVQAFSMELSAEQKEVWELVKTYWEVLKKGDKDVDLSAYYHKDGLFWNWSDLTPEEREQFVALRKHYFLGEIKSYKIEPMGIRIFGNVAIVMYVFNVTNIEDKNWYRRITSIYMKQDGKWLALGEMIGSCQRPSKCP